MSFDPTAFARLRLAAGMLNEARDEVTSCFRCVAEYLDSIALGLPADTAVEGDAGPFLAYRRMDGRYRLLIGPGSDEPIGPWEEAATADRIATVGQLPKLLERIIERTDALVVIADRAEATMREIRAAMGDV